MESMEQLIEDLRIAEKKELDKANEEHPLFASPHEGYGVIKEEYEEAREKLDLFEMIKEQEFWHDIRQDKPAEKRAGVLEEIALHVAAEAIQLAAMCRKYKDSSRKW